MTKTASHWNCPECAAENPLSAKECSSCGMIVPRAQREASAAENAPRRRSSARAADGEPADRRSTSRRSRQRPPQTNSSKKIVIGVIAALVLGGAAWWFLSDDSIEGRMESLVSTWSDSGRDRFASLAAGENWGDFDTQMARRNWFDEPPAMTVTEIVKQEMDGVEAAIVTCELEGGRPLLLAWLHRKKGWGLIDWTFPPIATEPGDETTNALRAAWATEGSEAFLAMMTEEYRQRMGAKIVRSLERREWLQTRPDAIGDVYYERIKAPMMPMVDASTAGDFRCEAEVGDGFLKLWWEYHHPDWKISKLIFPSR